MLSPLSLPPAGNSHGDLGDRAESPKELNRYFGLFSVHGSEAAVQSAEGDPGTCNDPTGTLGDLGTAKLRKSKYALVRQFWETRAKGVTKDEGIHTEENLTNDIEIIEDLGIDTNEDGGMIDQSTASRVLSPENVSDMQLDSLEVLYEHIDWVSLMEEPGVFTGTNEKNSTSNLGIMGLASATDKPDLSGISEFLGTTRLIRMKRLTPLWIRVLTPPRSQTSRESQRSSQGQKRASSQGNWK
jgi:hypothetical protein